MADTTEDVALIFEELGDLEKDFAQVELDACTPQPAALPCTIDQLIASLTSPF